MSNSRKLRRRLHKSPFVQKTIQNNIKEALASESKSRILFGEEYILNILNNLHIYERTKNKC